MGVEGLSTAMMKRVLATISLEGLARAVVLGSMKGGLSDGQYVEVVNAIVVGLRPKEAVTFREAAIWGWLRAQDPIKHPALDPEGRKGK